MIRFQELIKTRAEIKAKIKRATSELTKSSLKIELRKIDALINKSFAKLGY